MKPIESKDTNTENPMRENTAATRLYLDVRYLTANSRKPNKEKLAKVIEVIKKEAVKGKYKVTIGSDLNLYDDLIIEYLSQGGFGVNVIADRNGEYLTINWLPKP